jgi:hypothetical protein
MIVSALLAGVCAVGAGARDAKGLIVTRTARGDFEVKVTPQTSPDAIPARYTLTKTFTGDLAGTSSGEMLAAGTGAPGSSGAAVAIEKVTGTLGGRSGSFVLQHSATMTRGVPEMNIKVVPDSGTGELTGISGTFTIIIANGNHSYEFAYSLPGRD